MKRENSIKIIAFSGVFFLIAIFFSKLFGFLFRIAIARLGIEAYGTYSLGFSIITILFVFSTLGMGAGIQKYISFYKTKKQNKKLNSLISTSIKLPLLISCSIAILLFLFSHQISSFFLKSNPSLLSNILKILAIYIPLETILQILMAIGIGFKKAKTSASSYYIINSLSKLILVVIFIGFGWGIYSALLALILGNIISILFLYNKLNKINKIKIQKGVHKEIIIFSLPLLFSTLLTTLMLHINILLMGIFLNPKQIGIYNSALPTAQLILIFPIAILSLFLPIISEKQALKKSIKKEYQTVSKWILMIIIPISLTFIIFGKELLSFLFGQNYISGYSILVIFSISYLIFSLLKPAEQILYQRNKTKSIMIFVAIGLLFNLILVIILIPQIGANGAALANSFGILTSGFLIFLSAKKQTKFKTFNLQNILIFLIAIFSFTISFFLSKLFPLTIFRISIMIIISSIIYLFLLNKLKLLEQEKKLFQNE